MPNWVRNKILVGRKSTIDMIKEKYCTWNEDAHALEFDFDKVKKMPEDLMIEFSSKSDRGLCLYLTRICPDVDYYGSKEEKVTKERFDEISNSLKGHMLMDKELVYNRKQVEDTLEKYQNEEKNILRLGKRQIENVRNYNAINWYEWAVNNWGTKWNSSNLEIQESGRSMTFDTAWDPPIPVLVELSKKIPQAKFAMLYSDEEIGCHTGYILVQNGRIDYQGTFLDQSVDAYKLALDVWDCKDEYVINEEKETCTRLDEMKRSAYQMF